VILPGSECILVVDDDEMNRDMLSRRLERTGFTVKLARDGAEALEAIAREELDLVVLDVMMPGIDGLQALETLRRSRSPAELPVIMATARDGSDDVVRALKLGANDYVTKPLDFPVVLARIQTQLFLRRARRELEAAHARMRQELEAAARIQQALLPTSPPSVRGASFAWSYLPCDELAGDILDVFRIDDRRAGLYLLDVSGHGVPAALLSVAVSRVLSPRWEGSLLFSAAGPAPGGSPDGPGLLPPAAVASRLNTRFPMDGARQYFTFLYGIMDLEAREFRFVSAGHPGPIRVSREGRPQPLDGSGLPIGWFPDAVYQEQSVRLSPGDRLYLFSDGIPEAPGGAGGEAFGLERVSRALEQGRGVGLAASLEDLLGEIQEWCRGGRPADDLSLLALEVE
jgi:sigma-B regulation protein RsbU (phosphoserine phosphatase)